MAKKTTSRTSSPKKPSSSRVSTDHTTQQELIRVNGHLKEVVTVMSPSGDILHKIISPLMVEFYPKDVMQVIVGATLLAVPVAFTEETWNLGSSLPMNNVIGILIVSLLFIATFVYYNYYRRRLRNHWGEFLKRIFSTYIVSFIVVALIMALIQRLPIQTDWVLAFKRVVLVAFPASLSASVADVLK